MGYISAHYGWWNERLSSDKSFVTALKNICKTNILAMHAILKVQPEIVFIQSESTEYFHAEMTQGVCMDKAIFLNQKRFLTLALNNSFQVPSSMYTYLLDNGTTRAEYEWFMSHHSKKHCIMGNDYYVTNKHMMHHDGRIEPSNDIYGYYAITMPTTPCTTYP